MYMNKRILYSLVGVMLLAMLGVVWVTYTETENNDEALAGPPQLVTDPGYGATLSGSPYYAVSQSEEDLFAMSSCNLTDDRQNGWYEVVALNDGATVRDTIFKQAKFKEGDLFVAVIWNAEDKTFESLPNKIFKAGDGSRLPLLSLDKTLKKGTVIALNSNRDVEYCADNYDDTAGHENIYKGWNLVSKPNFEKVNELAVWTVDFGQPGPVQKYPKLNASDADTKDLSDDILYWVYGGSDAAGVTGGNNGGSQTGNDPEILLETLRTDGVAGTRVVNNNDELLLAEKEGTISMYVSLTSQPDSDVELEFQLYENGSRVSNVAFAKEVAIRSSVGSTAFQTGQNFTTNNYATKNNFVLVGIDDDKVEINNAEIRVVDKAGKMATRTFKVGIVDDDVLNGGAVCTQNLVYGLILSVKDQAQNTINDALVVVTDASGNEVERMTGTIGFSQYTLLAEREGTYTVSISKSGYKSTSFEVTLEKDECHVVTQVAEIVMENATTSGGTIIWNPNGTSLSDFINSGGFIDVEIVDTIYSPGYNFGDYFGSIDTGSNNGGGSSNGGETPATGIDSMDYISFNGLAGKVVKIEYDLVGKGFWAVHENGAIYENMTSGDKTWTEIPGLSTINRPSSYGGQIDYVKNPEDFFVIASSDKKKSTVVWVGNDNKLRTFTHNGSDIESQIITIKDQFGGNVKDAVLSKGADGSDAVYASYACTTGQLAESTGWGVFGTDTPYRSSTCKFRTVAGSGTVGGEMSMLGNRLFGKEDLLQIWSVDSIDGSPYKYNFTTNVSEFKTTSGTRSSVEEIFFDRNMVLGINKSNKLYYWNELLPTNGGWQEVKIRGGESFDNVIGFSDGLFRSQKRGYEGLYDVKCSDANAGDCLRSDETPIAVKIDSGEVPVDIEVVGSDRYIVIENKGSVYRVADPKCGTPRECIRFLFTYGEHSKFTNAVRVLDLENADGKLYGLVTEGNVQAIIQADITSK